MSDPKRAFTDRPTGELLLVDFRGRDGPGQAHKVLQTIQTAKCELLDITQYVIEGMLNMNILLECQDDSMERSALEAALRAVAEELQLVLDIRLWDPEASKASQGVSEDDSLVVAIDVITTAMLPVSLVHSLFECLSKRGWQLLEIEHQVDNRLDCNGKFNKVEFSVRCPRKTRISDIYLGLQPMLWTFDAELVVKPRHALGRPHKRSIIVFSLSNVLLTCDALDLLLKEAGCSAESRQEEAPAGSVEHINKKILQLRGKSSDCIERVIEKLPFTDDALFLCRSLKAMGFRLALLTSSGIRPIANYVGQYLGIDYVFARDVELDAHGDFTGFFAGEAKELKFRKVDYYQMMADKEGVPYRNVILAGEFLKGVRRDRMPEILDTFGPPILFNAARHKTLSMVLCLLGFSASDIDALRRKYDGDVGFHSGRRPSRTYSRQTSTTSTTEVCTRALVRLSSRSDVMASLTRLFAELRLPQDDNECYIRAIKQRTIRSETMIVGLELSESGVDLQALVAQALSSCEVEGLHVDLVENCKLEADSARRHILTIVEQPRVSPSTLVTIYELLNSFGVNILRMERLSSGDFSALQVVMTIPSTARQSVKEDLLEKAMDLPADIAFQEDNLEGWSRRLVVFDMRALVEQDVLEEMADVAGVAKEAAEIVKQAKEGQLDFSEALLKRVALFRGQDAAQLASKVRMRLSYTPGAHQLCLLLKDLGYKTAVMSTGCLRVAREVQRDLCLDYAFANGLDAEAATGLLTGLTLGPILTPLRKRTLLSMVADVEGCEVAQTIVVGYGANDIPLLCSAGLGIAFCSERHVQTRAPVRVNTADLRTILYLIGLPELATFGFVGPAPSVDSPLHRMTSDPFTSGYEDSLFFSRLNFAPPVRTYSASCTL
eukprot:TRINITY_DN91187_c0_g1_i1.p1 TRINITY_DN91187_c0_g1~~TRINITY_DN91187_c0_g1_i1.p1  ORF type:complete len:891 (+),score=177.90 TRINITY_DN91187_c0_g1_i1:109-2781(+)